MKKTKCPDCKGVGHIATTSDPIPQRDGACLKIVARVCSRCDGSGELPVIADVLATFGRRVA